MARSQVTSRNSVKRNGKTYYIKVYTTPSGRKYSTVHRAGGEEVRVTSNKPDRWAKFKWDQVPPAGVKIPKWKSSRVSRKSGRKSGRKSKKSGKSGRKSRKSGRKSRR